MHCITCKAALVALCVFVGVTNPVDASVFLGRGPPKVALAPLLEELERIVGKDHRNSTEIRANNIEDALRPTFLAMPKAPDGGVKPDAVRYMVHRYFVDRHGWFVDGLGSAGEVANVSSPASIFKDQEHVDVQDLFEVRFQKHSFSLHQVAVFAGALEQFVHTETLERLSAAYTAVGASPNAETSEEQIDAVIESYMVMYVLGSNYTEMTPPSMQDLMSSILDIYPTWGETKSWVGDVHREVVGSRNTDAPSSTSFDFAVEVLEEIGNRYGRWQNKECLDLKDSLLKLEDGHSGRVRLEKFYGSALEGNWQFSESVAYLRQLGALDETDPRRLSVIIPNYINSPTNCVASSKFYSVCCIDECESLVSQIENEIAAPEASPERIAEVVASMSSPTVNAPRTLPLSLLQRLNQIASHHHGTVPLHARLFVQWLHHAFPRECSYPHVSGTVNRLAPIEWESQTGETSVADKDTMQWHVATSQAAPEAEQEDAELPWLSEEEVYVSQTLPQSKDESSMNAQELFRRASLGATLVAALWTMTKLTKMSITAKTTTSASSRQKYCV